MNSGVLHSAVVSQELKVGSRIIYLRGALSARECVLCERVIRSCRFEPVIHQGKIAREEATLSRKVSFVSRYEAALIELAQILYVRKAIIETFAFKYREGHFIPWHRDNPRHYLMAIAYVGDFEGGAFVYRNGLRQRCVIQITRGDILISMNRAQDGECTNTPHKVEMIRHGERLCLATSVVSFEALDRSLPDEP